MCKQKRGHTTFSNPHPSHSLPQWNSKQEINVSIINRKTRIHGVDDDNVVVVGATEKHSKGIKDGEDEEEDIVLCLNLPPNNC